MRGHSQTPLEGPLRHLLRDLSDIASAVHEVSKTLASPGDTDFRRLRRLGRYLSGTQKLGIITRKCNDPGHLDAYRDVYWSGDSINRKSTSRGILKIGSATFREFTKRQSCQTLSSGESDYYVAVTTEALHFQRLLEFLGMPVKLRLRIDSTAARGIIQRQGCGPLKHNETRLLWLQAKHEERKLTVIKEPAQTNTTDGFTKALQQTPKYLDWRNRLSKGHENGDDVETSKREALAESGRWARVGALHAIPRPVMIATLMQQTFVPRGWND